ncbi:hypothetical protein LTR91_024841 [Friedmanniomyces endolithicus]|uniref:Uncharacterized protein n=2 Tax=Dothideomycetidae TaxID=451867 RepID=A0AAN6H128_9PEZI|nr:hypothetical protein LTR94_005161 [Friedmanniomyces endolithicus]KAK5144513.1 hypothetical protein LTR32_003574 [Rachicladosporium monterosium]KAK0773866.1 hypothetical protein LTR59_015123 [Friedmanniomyces endolithicus]KAK0788604.1 hypothetical protein LTR75_012535 [Friedmanniomyces endolithicus]KAK0804754.1 hypothetical protein LTR38_005651 [Friedmanniomyces endolithicus]
MSTGNPFRRQRLPDETTYHDAPTTILQSANTPKVQKKKKRVVIQTPPHSPEEPRRFADWRTESPPTREGGFGQQWPVVDGETDVRNMADRTTEDPVSGQSGAMNWERSSGGTVVTPPSMFPGTALSGQAGSRAPYNPFTRTLATSEAAFGFQAGLGQPEKGTAQLQQQQRQGGAGRPALDVDAFKNILMTGSATPSPPTGAASTSLQRPPNDSSSSTDTSSLSRNSIFDALPDAHPESPRTSFDDHADDDFERDGDDEHSSLMGPVAGRPVEEGPPAPPKQKHGRGFPQTVSFADFDESIPSASTPPLSLQIPPVLASMMRPPTPRSPSDLNKPLPRPPAERLGGGSAMSSEVPQTIVPASYQPSVPVQVDGQNLGKKTAPPPPPVARRRGQAEAVQGRARSESNLSQSSTQPTELGAPAFSDQPQAKPAPAPPPSRRIQANSNSDSPSPVVERPPSPTFPPTNTTAIAGDSDRVVPLPPPRRQPSMYGTSRTRTPSNASRASLPRSESFTGGVVVPPPAPPPRRGAKRNSVVEHRRTSGQSFGSVGVSERSMDMRNGVLEETEPDGGEEETQNVFPAPVAQTERSTPDVLADLDAFQAEIEALRIRAAGGG